MEKPDSLWIMCVLVFLEYPVEVLKWKHLSVWPFCSAAAAPTRAPSNICQHFSSHPSDLIGWTSGAVCPFYLQLISAAFAGAPSPWIFISPLTPLNVNSSFPVLLFISVAWWFDHAENTRLAIASSLVLPQGHLLLKCYCLCCLNPLHPGSAADTSL